jgi:YHS domain-containing protein
MRFSKALGTYAGARAYGALAGAAAAALLAAVAFGQDKPAKPDQQKPPDKPPAAKPDQKPEAGAAELPNCAVMDEPVDFGVSTMTDDGPVYFCCADCIPKFKADAKKYANKVAAQRAALAKLAKVQVTCPLTGKTAKKEHFVEDGGQKVYFCCPNCPEKYKKNPAEFKAKLAASYSYQTRCPVSGEAIDPAAFTDLPDGHRVYFCCPECGGKLLKDPARYAPKLEKQGILLDLDKIKAGAGEKKDSGEQKGEQQDRPRPKSERP